MTRTPRPALLLTCTRCGKLHVPIQPLELNLHPLCPRCALPHPLLGNPPDAQPDLCD